MSNSLRIAVFSAAFVFIKPAFGQGTLAFHSGANDPTTEGFNLVEEQPARVGSVFNDATIDAWQTYCDETSNVFAKAYYQQTFTAQQSATMNNSDWTLTVTARAALNIGGANSVVVNTGTELFLLGFQNITPGDLIIMRGAVAQSVLIDGQTSSYHTYQLDYHAATDSADLSVDGIDTINGIIGASLGVKGNGALTFGEINSGEANWSVVSFATVPEPSSFSIATLSCFFGAFCIRFKYARLSNGKGGRRGKKREHVMPVLLKE